MKTSASYPEIDHLLHAYFGEDFDLSGHTIEEIVGCYKRETATEHHRTLREEIADFIRAHPQDLDATFQAAYACYVDPPLWSHTTASFLTEVDRLLSNPGSAPPPP